MDFKNIAAAVVLFGNALLIFALTGKARRNASIALFTATLGAVFLWTFAIIPYRMADTESSVFWAKMLYASASLIPSVFLTFVLLFPLEKFLFSVRIFLSLFVPNIIILGLIFYKDLVIRQVIFPSGQEKIILFGPVYFIFVLYMACYFSMAIFSLINKYRKAQGFLRTQLAYILFSTTLSISIGSAFNLLLPTLGNFYFNWLGQIGTVVTISSIAYAILRVRLFGMHIILTEFLVGIIAILLFFNILTAETSFEYVWKSVMLLAFSVAGFLLLRGVFAEIRQREELERLAADLSAANEQLTTLDRAKSEFIAIASHQLRTPLTAIKGYISLLMEGTYGVLREKQKKPMNGVFQSAERLIRLVNDLLSISRIESGKIEAKLEPTDIKKLIEGVIEELRVKVEGKGLTLNLENSHGAMPTIMADEEKIRNVLMNIIDNAIRYTSRGGIAVYFKLEEAERKIRIEIKDTGEGMTQEEMGKLFESFSRGTAGQRIWTEGAGLGLYIAKKFIEMHKGRVWAESGGKGKGSEFVIELPIA